MLDHFRHARAQLAFGQGEQKAWVSQNQFRRMKRADEIFSFGQIKSRLAAK